MVYLAILLAVCYSLWLFIAIVYSDIGKAGCSRGCQQVVHFAGLLFAVECSHIGVCWFCLAAWLLRLGGLVGGHYLWYTNCALLGVQVTNSLTRRHFSCVPWA